jgi:DNA-binding NtrC family response regulator
MPTLRELVDGHERMIIVKTLIQNDGDRSRTADALGVPKTTLWNLIKKHKIGEEIPGGMGKEDVDG